MKVELHRKYLQSLIVEQFTLSLHGDHGLDHWQRVEKVGIILTKESDADIEVIRLFALLHDSQRIIDGHDPDHGNRAALYAQNLFDQGLLDIREDQFETLKYACRHHNDRSTKSNDITVNICWDSDRIDLVRVGIKPEEIVLATDAGRKFLRDLQD